MTCRMAVENIGDGGCAASIRGKLPEEELALNVGVDADQGAVRVDGNPEWREQVAPAPAGIDHPESGSLEGIRAATARARSVAVSGAIGRLDNAIHESDV